MLSQTEQALIPFAVVGGLSIITVAYKTFHFFSPYLRTGNLQKYLKSDGPYALVTGSTSGIGYALAYELSSKGFNVILHGRNATKLSKIQADLSAAFPAVKYRQFIADVTAPSHEMAATISEFVASIKDLNLRVLMNNVGGAHCMRKHFTPFAEHTTQEINDLAAANMLFTTHLTRALFPLLTEHQPSLILNTGSCSQSGTLYLPVYSATKAYLSAWGNALSTEMQAEGLDIEVLTVLSGNTQSGQDARAADFTRPTSERFAKAALEKVGQGRAVVVGYIGHAIIQAVLESLPEWACRSLMISLIKPIKGKNLGD